jgi:cellulose biosynthesis protein BcsQ
MRKICLFNQKNDNVALNVFASIAREKKRVLICDFRHHSTAKKQKATVFDLLNEDIDPKKFIQTLEPNLDIIYGDAHLNIQEFNTFYKLHELNYFTKKFQKLEYDYIIVEVSDILSLLTTNALFFATEIMSFIDMDKNGTDFLHKLTRFTYQYNKIYGRELFISKVVPIFENTIRTKDVKYLLSEFTSQLIAPPIKTIRDDEFGVTLNDIAISILVMEEKYDSMTKKNEQRMIQEYLNIITEKGQLIVK